MDITPFKRSFKVTNVGANQKLICDFLLAINTILHPILHRFQVASDRGMSHFNGLAEGDPLRISP